MASTPAPPFKPLQSGQVSEQDARVHTASQVNALAAAGDLRFAFLRAQWFAASGTKSPVLAHDETGEPIAAFALNDFRKGPLTFKQVGGSYWPFRGVPIARGASEQALSQALASKELAAQLGWAWRVGPVSTDDEAAIRLQASAQKAGWHVLSRTLGTCFELDLGELTRSENWPSSKTQRKNRWRKRRLAESGEVRVEMFTGANWTAQQRDAMATIEAASWLGKLEGGGDTKFRDQQQRSYWENLCEDRALAAMLFGSVMYIGETPAAFTFGVQSGDCRYYIANNYDDSFTKFGPGRVLLYDDFAAAAEKGIELISWGLGDAGYKAEMGARAGPEVKDLLFVRNRLAALALKPVWERA
ncbi:MAG: GNAT family N-acetyltransferase [Erythrobacter sp.]